MTTLRLFAGARVAAGESRAEISGDTVGDVLDAAAAKYGERFVEILDVSKFWVNGKPAERSTAVQDTDEVAVLPPVSGG